MSNDTLNVMFPQGKSLNIRDANIVIKPFKFGDLPKVFKAVDPIFGVLMEVMKNRTNQFEMMSKILAEAGDNAIDLMVIGSKQNREWIEDLDLDEGVDILAAIFEVNADFFVRKVLPNLNKRLEETTIPGQTQ